MSEIKKGSDLGRESEASHSTDFNQQELNLIATSMSYMDLRADIAHSLKGRGVEAGEMKKLLDKADEKKREIAARDLAEYQRDPANASDDLKVSLTDHAYYFNSDLHAALYLPTIEQIIEIVKNGTGDWKDEN